MPAIKFRGVDFIDFDTLLSDDERLVRDTARKFIEENLIPIIEECNRAGRFPRELVKPMADLGFFGASLEGYGCAGMSNVEYGLVTQELERGDSGVRSFVSVQSALVMYPIYAFGSDEQKNTWLPAMQKGEKLGCFGLTEPDFGSNPGGMRTRARKVGHEYVLNGEKMWITNGGTADLYTVFAKVDGEKFSAFLVERNTPGLSVGKEEHKLGIRGSSTCPLVLTDCRIPVGNLLGEVGKGHHIAFNVLNMGRLKLGASCVGGSRVAIEYMVKYAKERTAFGKTLAGFGLIQRKVAESVIRLFVAESMLYRTTGMMDASLGALEGGEAHSAKEIQKRIEEYAVECSILKVFGSETLGYVADELVQTMGGYGYVEDYPAERLYRDARINRIFEGTNEINRMIITGWLMKRALTGKLPLLPAIKKLMDELMEPPSFEEDDDAERVLAREEKILGNLRKITLMSAGAASQRFMMELENQQEVMADLSECITAVYGLESAMVRARKLTAAGAGSAVQAQYITAVYADAAMGTVEQAARRVLAAASEGDALGIQLTVLRRFARHTPVDDIALTRAIARQCLETGRYRIG